jgi:hypothetical protein
VCWHEKVDEAVRIAHRLWLTCGPAPERHIAAIQAYANAGYDEVHIAQIGPDQAGMIRFYEREILPHFR